MQDEEPAPIGGLVDRLPHELDAAENPAVVLAQGAIVVTRHVDDARALSSLVDDRAQHIVVRFRPIESALEAPEIEDVADEIELLDLDAVQKIQQLVARQPLKPR